MWKLRVAITGTLFPWPLLCPGGLLCPGAVPSTDNRSVSLFHAPVACMSSTTFLQNPLIRIQFNLKYPHNPGRGGEEGVELWTLQQTQSLLVHTVQTQLCLQGSDLPTQPHVRLGPEAVAAAQLFALQQGQLAIAAGFDCSEVDASQSSMDTRSARRGSGAHDGLVRGASADALLARMLTWRRLLTHPCYSPLGDAAAHVEWGPSAMDGPEEALLEVAVGGAAFVWRVALQGDGCWRVADVMVAQLGLGRGVEMPGSD